MNSIYFLTDDILYFENYDVGKSKDASVESLKSLLKENLSKGPHHWVHTYPSDGGGEGWPG